MPVFLEELNLWSWTGPQEYFYCSSHWFNSHGRHISSAGGAKAGWKRGICVGFLLVQSCSIITEKKRTCFPLFPEDKPRTWRLLWGGGWRRCCHLLTTHSSLAGRLWVFGCWEIARGFVHQLDLSSSQALDLESVFRPAVTKKHLLFSAVGFSGLLFCDGIWFVLGVFAHF